MTRTPLAIAVLLILSTALSCARNDPAAPAVAPEPRPTTAATAPDELLRDQSASLAYGAESYRVISRPDEIVSVLKNGLTVITKRVPSPVVSVRAYVAAGGVYEGKWLGGGLSHLLEHLVAGGSNERRTEAENRNLLQELGNNSNAYTYADRTAFFVNTTTDNAAKAVDLVAGWMLGAKITRAEYAREYMVVQRELEKDKGEADWVYYDLANFNRYLVSPARVPVIGYQEVIQGLSRDDVYAYYKLAYVPNNMLFVVAGDKDPEALLAMVQQNVKDAKPGRAFGHDIAGEPPVRAPRTQVATFPKLGQARAQIGFPSVKITDADLYALDLLSTVLGGGDSSILNEEIRDKRQLVTEVLVSSATPAYVEGTFAVDFKCDPAKLADATRAIVEQLEKMKTGEIDPERVKRAKSIMRTSSVYGRQTAETIAESLADGYLSAGDPHFLDHYTDRIQKVEPKDLQRVAAKYLDAERLITTVLLPEEFVGAAGLPKAQQVVAAATAGVTNKAATTKPASPVERVVLDNGTVLLVKRMTASPVVSINLYARGGASAEDEKSNGLGNFAMEMLTRGTKTKSAQQLAETFDALGAQVEAGCANNNWFWKATGLAEDFPKLMEAYADVVNNASFPESEIAPMKERVLAAIEGQDADWFAQAMRFFRKTYFGPQKSPYQFTVLGSSERVKAMTRNEIQQWYEKEILSRPRVLAIYGDVDVAQAKELAKSLFGKGAKSVVSKPETSEPKLAATTGVPTINVIRVEVQKTNNPQAGVVVGFPTASTVATTQQPVIDMADCLTSGYGYPTGYIFEILRGRGLVYDANAFNFPGLDRSKPGALIAYAGCDPKNVNECAAVILESVARLQGTDADVNADWFGRSKKLITTGEAMQNETAGDQAARAALDELYGLGYDHHARFADRINKVTPADVRTFAGARLNECVITVSTPEPDWVKIPNGPRTYKSFPEVDLTPKGVQHDTGGGAK
jgi:zinc protease